MLDLNQSHQHFDLVLELLCSLPPVNMKACVGDDPRPWAPRLTDLAGDLGLACQQSVRRLLSEIGSEHRIVIATYRSNGAFRAAVERHHWHKAQQLAQAYWGLVYGKSGEARPAKRIAG